MNGAVRRVADLDGPALDAWRALAGLAVQPNPLFEPDCLVPAARHLPEGDGILLATAEEDGRWFGCFPVRVQPSWRALHRPVLVTSVRRMIYDGTPLLDRERGADAMAALLGALREGGLPGITVFDWLDEGPVDAVLAASSHAARLPYRVYDRWVRPVLVRCPDGGGREGRSKNSLRVLARSRRRLADAAGGEVRLVDRGGDPGAVDHLLALEMAGRKGRNGVAVETRRGEPEWFRAMSDGFRTQGRLHVYSLEAGDRVAATILLVSGGEGMFALKLAHDETLGPYSPGVQLHLEVAERLRSMAQVRWIDTCTYEGNETLLRVYPDRRRVSSVAVATGGTVDRVVLRAVSRARESLGRTAAPAPVG